MGGAGRSHPHAGVAVVLLVGGVTFLLHALHGLETDETALTFLFGILVPMMLSVLVLGGAVWLHRSDVPAGARLRVAGWCVAGGVLMALTGALVVLHQYYEGVLLADRLFVVASTATTGALVGFVVGVYDAQRRKVAERLGEERARAERLNQRLSVVNRVLRHDVRNGVNVIQGYAEVLVDRFDDDDARVIRDRIVDLHELTETARAVERALEGGPTETAVDVVPVLESVVGRVRGDHPEAAIALDAPDSAYVRGSPQLGTAFQNVVDNAIEHNDADVPRVDVSVVPPRAGGSTVAVEVADDGPGMPPDQRDVFERGWESPLEHSPGTGLWLASWIVEDVGGEVSLEPNEPRGTTVVVRLQSADAAVDGR